jgi:hypothetical protein
MPTARQLLEQADALMRRNRKRGKKHGSGPPTLTDALDVEPGALAPTILLQEAAVTEADPIALETLSDVPVLTDVVDLWASPAPAPVSPAAADVPADAHDDAHNAALDDALEADARAAVPGLWAGDDPDALGADTCSAQEADAHSDAAGGAGSPHDEPEVEVPPSSPVAGDAEDATAPTTHGGEASATRALPALPDEDFILDIPPAPAAAEGLATPVAAPPSAAADAQPALVPGSAEWEALAEEIRMQVLQRLDLFTDTGMRDQLGARLQPIVARASAELVETINHALGELVRGYVAEAIEREIESWRKRTG